VFRAFTWLLRGIFPAARPATLYLHYPCFDGVVSGALAWQFLETHRHWKIEHICPVNYDLRDTWLSTSLQIPCAVVDFLYHPQASFWADHHSTTFLTEQARRDYEQRWGPDRLYDEHSGSCAALLWRHTAAYLGSAERYKEMVEWAEKIDSASYISVEEAILGNAPALRINLSLSRGRTQEYCEFLVRQLRRGTLQRLAELSEVAGRYEVARKSIEAGLQFMDAKKRHPDENNEVRLEPDGVASFRLQPPAEVTISRYAPYYFFPDAAYSIGLVGSKKGFQITAMRNPWREFQSIPLGDIFAEYGGGGHERVGSVFLPDADSEKAEKMLSELLREMRIGMRSRSAAASAAV
jgi:hypothetical protein